MLRTFTWHFKSKAPSHFSQHEPWLLLRHVSVCCVSRGKDSQPEWGSKKFGEKHRKHKVLSLEKSMDPEVEKLLEPFRALVKEQGDVVR